MRTSLVCVAALALSGCPVHAPFDRTKPVVEHRSWWWGDEYSQGDGRIRLREMLSALESEETARPHVERWRRYSWATPALVIAGGVSMGFGHGELTRDGGSSGTGWALLGAGVGSLVTSQVVGAVARSAAHDAVTAHNVAIQGTARAPAGACLLPGASFVVLPDVRGRAAYGGRIALVF